MTEKNQPAEDIPCPVCSLKGRARMLQLYQINFNEAIYWCGLKDCTYPKGHKCIIINRNIMETCSDTESGSTDSDIEKITQMFTERARKKIKRASKVKSSFSLDTISDLDSDSDSSDDIEKAFDILKGRKYINVNKNNIFIKCNKDNADNNALSKNSVIEITKDLINSSIVNGNDNNSLPVKLSLLEKIKIDQNQPNDISNLLNDMPSEVNLTGETLKEPNLNKLTNIIAQENVYIKSKVQSNNEDMIGCENLTQNSISSSILSNDKLNDKTIPEKLSQSCNVTTKPTEIQNLPKEIDGKNLTSIFDSVEIDTDKQINEISENSKLSSDLVKIEIKTNDVQNENVCKSTRSIFDPCEMETNIFNTVIENRNIHTKLTVVPTKINNLPNDIENISPNLTSTPLKIEMKKGLSNNVKENELGSTNFTSDFFKTDFNNSDVPNDNFNENISKNVTSTPSKFEMKKEISTNVKENKSENTNLISDPSENEFKESVPNDLNLHENISQASTLLKFETIKDISDNLKENVSESTDLTSEPFKFGIKNSNVSNGVNLHENISQNNTSTPLKHETEKNLPNNVKEIVSENNLLTSVPVKIEIKNSDASNDVNLHENSTQNNTSTPLKLETEKNISNNVEEIVSESNLLTSVPVPIEIKNSDVSNNVNLHENISQNNTFTPLNLETKKNLLNSILENESGSNNLISDPLKFEIKTSDVSNKINLHKNISRNLTSSHAKIEKNDISNDVIKNVSQGISLTPDPFKIEIKNSDASNDVNLHENITQSLTSKLLKNDISNNVKENGSDNLTEIKCSDQQNDTSLNENISYNLILSPSKSKIKNLIDVTVNPLVSAVPFKIEIKIGDMPNNLHENTPKTTDVNSAPFKIKINSDEKVNIPIQNIQNCIKNRANLDTNLNSKINKLEVSKSQKINYDTNINLIPNRYQNSSTSKPIEIEVLNNKTINIDSEDLSNVNNVSNISSGFDLPDLSQIDLENVENKSTFNNSLELNLDDKMNLTDMINNADNLDIENMPIIFGDSVDNDKMLDISLMETSPNSSNLIQSSQKIGKQDLDNLTNISPIKITINPNGVDSLNNLTYESVSQNIFKRKAKSFTKPSQNISNILKLNSSKLSLIPDDFNENLKTASLTNEQKSVSKTNILNRIKLPDDSAEKIQKHRAKSSSILKINERFGVIQTSKVIVNNSSKTKITEKQILAMKKIQALPGIKKICFVSNKNEIPLKKSIQMPPSPSKGLSSSLISAALSATKNSLRNKASYSQPKVKNTVSKSGPSRFEGFNFEEPETPVSLKPNETIVHSSPKKSNVPVIQQQNAVNSSEIMNDILDLDIDKVNPDLGAGSSSNTNMDVKEMDDWLSSLLN